MENLTRFKETEKKRKKKKKEKLKKTRERAIHRYSIICLTSMMKFKFERDLDTADKSKKIMPNMNGNIKRKR